MSRKLRNRLFTLHTWLGLHFSIFFFFLFLTGSLLVVGNELESIPRSAVWTTAAKADRTASFGTIYDGIKDAYPESDIQVITKRPTPWFVDRSTGHTGWGEQIDFWTDPKTGAVVETTRRPGFQTILREFHVKLLSGQHIIYVAVTATSIVLLYQIVSGLITYRRFWKGFFRWPNSASGLRPWAGGMHRLTAIWATPLLLLSAATAFFFLLHETVLDGTRPKPQPPTPRETALPAGFTAATLDMAEARAREAFPGFEPQALALPGKKSESFKFSGYLPGVPHIRGFSTVVIDPETLGILGAFTPNDSTGMARWRPMVDELHYGFWGGAFSRALWLVFGLVATGIAFTGAVIFAARLAPEDPRRGFLGRIWRGLGIFRWAYVLLLIGVLLGGYVNLGPPSYRTTRVFPEDAPNAVARLLLKEPLRRSTPIDVELRVGEPGISAAQIEINGEASGPIDLNPGKGAAWARFRLDPPDKEIDVVAHLIKPDGSERSVTFRLGRPIW